MPKVTIASANNLFKKKKYIAAVEEFDLLINSSMYKPLAACMVGKCYEELNDIDNALNYYKKAISFDDTSLLANREYLRFLTSCDMIDSNKKIIHHFFPTTTNIGDAATAFGIQKILNLCSEALLFIPHSCRISDLDSMRKDSSASGIIIGGGGLYFNQSTPSGWFFPATKSEIQSLGLPVATYAVGFNQEFQNSEIWNIDKNLIDTILDFNSACDITSVRDYWSINLLKEAGDEKIEFVPCASEFLEPLSWYNILDSNTNIVAISITDRAIKNSLKSKNIITSFLKFANWLKQEGFSPLFVMHDSGDDMALAQLLSANNFSLIIPQTPREAITIYEKCECVIGMRGHSLILSSGRGVPSVGVSYNRKVDAFMEIVGLESYCLNQDDIENKQVLIEMFEKMMANKKEISNGLLEKRDKFFEINLNYGRKLLSAFNIKSIK